MTTNINLLYTIPMNIIFRIVIYAIAVFLITYFLPGVSVDGFGTSLIVAIGLILLNATLGFFLKIITLPINVVTLGCFSFVINAIVILVVDQLVAGFAIDGFVTAIFFSLIFAVITSVMEGAVGNKKKRKKKRW